MLFSGQIKYVSISAANGTTSLQAAVAGKRINLVGLVLSSDGASATVNFQSVVTGLPDVVTDITGLIKLTQYNNFNLETVEVPWVQTGVGGALKLVSSAAVSGVAVVQIS